MKKITLTRNGQTSPRDTEVSTMHADGLAAEHERYAKIALFFRRTA